MTDRNLCSAAWIDAFLRRRDPARTSAEAEFVARQLPQPGFTTVLDAPCGLGRHANALAAKGYRATGIDRNAALVAEARSAAAPGAQFAVHDMAHLDRLEGGFDAAICLWHSFGWFDDAANAAVLRGFAQRLRPGGRFVVDVFHRGFFARRQGPREIEAGGLRITEERRLSGRREIVTLRYADGRPDDVFDWRLYTPDELIETASAAGFACLLACARFDERVPASDAEPAMQLVFELRRRDGAGAR